MKIKFTVTTLFSLVLVQFCVGQSSFKMPEGYQEYADWGSDSSTIRFDFDKDGKMDIAMIINKIDTTYTYNSEGMHLLVYLSSLDTNQLVDFAEFFEPGEQFGSLKFKNGIVVFEYNGGARNWSSGYTLKLRYDTQLKNFKLIGYDLSYSSSQCCTNGYFEMKKSYNLINGKYNGDYMFDSGKRKYYWTENNRKLFTCVLLKDIDSKLSAKLGYIGDRAVSLMDKANK